MGKVSFIIKDKKIILILALLVLLVAILVLQSKGKTAFTIEDKCGKFVNLMSHTIEDEGTCRTRCRSQCSAVSMDYSDVKFTANKDSCNSCICYCR